MCINTLFELPSTLWFVLLPRNLSTLQSTVNPSVYWCILKSNVWLSIPQLKLHPNWVIKRTMFLAKQQMYNVDLKSPVQKQGSVNISELMQTEKERWSNIPSKPLWRLEWPCRGLLLSLLFKEGVLTKSILAYPPLLIYFHLNSDQSICFMVIV